MKAAILLLLLTAALTAIPGDCDNNKINCKAEVDIPQAECMDSNNTVYFKVTLLPQETGQTTQSGHCKCNGGEPDLCISDLDKQGCKITRTLHLDLPSGVNGWRVWYRERINGGTPGPWGSWQPSSGAPVGITQDTDVPVDFDNPCGMTKEIEFIADGQSVVPWSDNPQVPPWEYSRILCSVVVTVGCTPCSEGSCP